MSEDGHYPYDPIYSFTGNYRFLSNFYEVLIRFESMTFATVEHAYQAAKTTDRAVRAEFQNALMTPGSAKRRGKNLTLRPGWEGIKIDIMRLLLREKFSDQHLADMLMSTKGRELIEGNTWGDTFWGKIFQGGQLVGENHLGKLLMEIRDEVEKTRADR